MAYLTPLHFNKWRFGVAGRNFTRLVDYAKKAISELGNVSFGKKVCTLVIRKGRRIQKWKNLNLATIVISHFFSSDSSIAKTSMFS